MQWAIDQLAAYRSDHTITTTKDWRDDVRLGFVLRCATCGVRVNPIVGGYRHDAGELAELAVIAAGILPKIDWTIPEPEARQLATEADIARLEDANRWTEEELVTIAVQSGLDVSHA